MCVLKIADVQTVLNIGFSFGFFLLKLKKIGYLIGFKGVNDITFVKIELFVLFY